MKKIIVCIGIGMLLTSCGGGWSCQKRYVKMESKKQVSKNTKEC
ncbi:hypothetical protein [Flavobacterium sp.]|nr:hypothetical protein [Flavobacterium sp.]